MEDIETVVNCMLSMRGRGIDEGYKIGEIVRSPVGQIARYHVGEIVLFKEESDPEHSPLEDVRPFPTVTIESPLTQEGLYEERARGSLISTMRTMVNVPKRFVREITREELEREGYIL